MKEILSFLCVPLERSKKGMEFNMGKRVLLGMSGGVDSSVSAILLKEQGYDVIGINMLLWGDDTSNASDARKVCKKLNIPFTFLDLRNDFKRYVVQDFIVEYRSCHTPNPCIMCNKFMKFGIMYTRAKELKCDYIATGHYANIEFDEKYNSNVLKKANNLKKDQSYVLYDIKKELLNHIIFPLGKFNSKEEIRKLATENGLEVANKPDSEDICFIENGNYKEFLETKAKFKPKEGNIVDKKGNVLGKHSGLYKYTIGQRKGLGISNPEPLFVIDYNKLKNELIVGEEKDLYKESLLASNINWLIDNVKNGMRVEAKIRYAAEPKPAKLILLPRGYARVIFDEPQRAITPGQSVVFYDGDTVLGGGKILSH